MENEITQAHVDIARANLVYLVLNTTDVAMMDAARRGYEEIADEYPRLQSESVVSSREDRQSN